MSRAQILYIKKKKKQRILIRILRLLLLILFFLLWETAARLSWIDSYIFSSPSRIVTCFISMLSDGSILFHIGVTLTETLLSFLFVMLCSLFLATLLWRFPTAFQILEPSLVVLNSLPKSALAPLLIVWLGTDLKTIVVTGMSVAIFGSVLSLCTDFQQTDAEKSKLITALGGSRLDILRLVTLPSNLKNILNLMKVNIGLCLVGVVIGEFISSRRGLGYLIIYGSQVFRLDWVILSIFILCLIAMGLYRLISFFEQHFCRS